MEDIHVSYRFLGEICNGHGEYCANCIVACTGNETTLFDPHLILQISLKLDNKNIQATTRITCQKCRVLLDAALEGDWSVVERLIGAMHAETSNQAGKQVAP